MVPSQFSALVSMLQKTTIKIIIHGEALLIFAFICNVGQPSLEDAFRHRKKSRKVVLNATQKEFFEQHKMAFQLIKGSFIGTLCLQLDKKVLLLQTFLEIFTFSPFSNIYFFGSIGGLILFKLVFLHTSTSILAKHFQKILYLYAENLRKK